MLESDLLRTFIAIAETKNFTKAGEMVGRTQSAISIQMKKLEEKLGEVFFDRQSRGVQLTVKGEELLLRARRIISLLEETESALKTAQPSGIVRLGITEETSSSRLPLILARFGAAFPDVEVVVKTAPSITHISNIANRVIDLAIIYDREDSQRYEALCDDAVVWVTSIVHQPHLREPLPVATYSINTWARAQSVEMLEKREGRHRFLYYAEGCNALIPAVQAGLAIAPLARSMIPLDCRELLAAEGFPPVENSKLVLCTSPHTSSVIDGMAQAIRDTFTHLT